MGRFRTCSGLPQQRHRMLYTVPKTESNCFYYPNIITHFRGLAKIRKLTYTISMKKLILFLNLVVFSVPLWGYEFVVSALTTPIGKAAPKRVLVRNKDSAAVIFLKTRIAHLKDQSDATIEQAQTPDGYVLYIAPNWRDASLWLTAPGFVPKEVKVGNLPPGAVREISISAAGKDPRNFNLSAARLSFVMDPTNATAATSQTYAPEIWFNTDASFSQVQPLLKEGSYAIINGAAPPYRISPKRKKAKAGDVLSPVALGKLGNIAKMPLEERTVYNLDISW